MRSVTFGHFCCFNGGNRSVLQVTINDQEKKRRKTRELYNTITRERIKNKKMRRADGSSQTMRLMKFDADANAVALAS